MLQIQKKRVPPVLYKLIDPSNPKSQEEWAKQAGVRSIRPKSPKNDEKPDTIEVHASFDRPSAYFGLLAYLEQFAGKELLRCHEWARLAQKKGCMFQFPWMKIDSSQVEAHRFEGRKYSFPLDHEKILQLLTGHTLYNDYRVAIREVLQNALDAVRFQKLLSQNEANGTIEIIWDSKARRLKVLDTGTGMTQETIEKFLLNVGSSFYQSESVLQKYSEFSPISRFGIGILSTFMIADEVQILTVHPEEEEARRLTLPSVVKSYLIEKISKDSPDVQAIGPHGTEVVLQVRRSADLKDVEALVRFWLVIPQCEVTCKTDDSAPVRIGFPNANAVLDYYYQQQNERKPWTSSSEVRTESTPGIELAYVVSKSIFSDVWDFSMNLGYGGESQISSSLSTPPGIYVEGVRVRSVPVGFDKGPRSLWTFANFTGHEAPKTNVARSDVEQTPELDRALQQIYSMFGTHIQNEFDRLRKKKIGIVEAAWEADYMMTGLKASSLSNRERFQEAMSDIRIIALENENSCRAVTQNEFESVEIVWSVDSRLVRNLEGICGVLGIDQPANSIISGLNRAIQMTIPEPRLLGRSDSPLVNREVGKIRIYPENRSYRIDICWEKKKPGRWTHVPDKIFRGSSSDDPEWRYANRSVWITNDAEVSSECPEYDLVVWRDRYMFLETSPMNTLLDIFGPTEIFVRWFFLLLSNGEIPNKERPLLKQYLAAAEVPKIDELLSSLILPFDRRIGDLSRGGERAAHIFEGNW